MTVNARGLLASIRTPAVRGMDGFSGALTVTPSADGRGLSMRLGSGWGATHSGVESLWSRQNAAGLVRHAPVDAAQAYQLEVRYGLDGRQGRARWAPYLGVASGGGSRQALRLGVTLTVGRRLDAGLELGQRQGGRATGAPTITGTAQVGQPLTAGTTAIMDADGLTSVSYTYRVDPGWPPTTLRRTSPRRRRAPTRWWRPTRARRSRWRADASTVEAGLRYDTGPETGALEVQRARRRRRPSVGRALLAPQDTAYEEWGFSGALTVTPSADGRGLSMRLGSGWGATHSGYCRRQRADHPQLHVPVDPGGRHGRGGHCEREFEHLPPGRRRPGHDPQGAGDLRRRPLGPGWIRRDARATSAATGRWTR